ncbi:hypothetical protein SAMN05216227_101282 [Pseudorhodobacter antarcticus]|uniref:Uncharacterized protein n=1 Tax=Pseudorhodobacter antarcticus TaxID=1077947 RepID=A0A1H8G1C5_9RHOB|nr:hypothetical protein [Pseudorhodobacter antarcticus]SEN37574.1 hypothetical protein SAMN05216227_101282 [Pseudorhodobacter antarcticus]
MDYPVRFADVDEVLLLQILETQVTLDIVRALLRDKGLSFSASSWAEMKETRLMPALVNGQLLKADLVELIRQAEEHGRKHVRLFQYDPDKLAELTSAFDMTNVESWASAKSFPLSGEYVFAAFPDRPTVTEVRVGDGSDKNCFVLKVAKTDQRRKAAVLQDWNGGQAYIAEVVLYRAVDVVKVHANGMVEVRLDPRSERPISYSGSARAALGYLNGLVATDPMVEMSLANAKAALSALQTGDEATKHFQLNQASLRNTFGDKILSSSQIENGGMVASSVMTGVLGLFNGGAYDPYCEHVRVSYNYSGGKQINAILSDDINEIIFTASLSRHEYDDAMGSILKLNVENS